MDAFEEIPFTYVEPKSVSFHVGGSHQRVLPFNHESSSAWSVPRLRRLVKFWGRLLLTPDKAFATSGRMEHVEIMGDQTMIKLDPGEKLTLRVNVSFPCRVVGIDSEGFRQTMVGEFKIGGGCNLLHYEDWSNLRGVSGIRTYRPEGQLRDKPLLFSPNEANVELWNAGSGSECGRVFIVVERMSQAMLDELHESRKRLHESCEREYEGMVGGGLTGALAGAYVKERVGPSSFVPSSVPDEASFHADPDEPMVEVPVQFTLATREDFEREVTRLALAILRKQDRVADGLNEDGPVSTHRCNVCGSLWSRNEEGSWSLVSGQVQWCCDNPKARIDHLDPIMVMPKMDESVSTHRCKECGALWKQHDDESWTLVSGEPGECCDNVEMGDQLEPFVVGVVPVTLD